MSQHNYVTVIGVFHNGTDARAAVSGLRDRGLKIDDISIVERDPARYDPVADYTTAEYEYRTINAEEFGNDTGGGLVLGSLVGGTLGTLAGLGALLIPGIGPVLAAGPLVGALIGGTTGAITGTLTGALIDAFKVPEEHATIYSERLARGNTMVAVHVDVADAPAVRDHLHDANAERFEWPEVAGADRSYYW